MWVLNAVARRIRSAVCRRVVVWGLGECQITHDPLLSRGVRAVNRGEGQAYRRLGQWEVHLTGWRWFRNGNNLDARQSLLCVACSGHVPFLLIA